MNMTNKSLSKGPLHDAGCSISLEECKIYLSKFNLSDEKILEIRNYLNGIIDKSLNAYLDEFR